MGCASSSSRDPQLSKFDSMLMAKPQTIHVHQQQEVIHHHHPANNSNPLLSPSVENFFGNDSRTPLSPHVSSFSSSSSQHSSHPTSPLFLATVHPSVQHSSSRENVSFNINLCVQIVDGAVEKATTTAIPCANGSASNSRNSSVVESSGGAIPPQPPKKACVVSPPGSPTLLRVKNPSGMSDSLNQTLVATTSTSAPLSSTGTNEELAPNSVMSPARLRCKQVSFTSYNELHKSIDDDTGAKKVNDLLFAEMLGTGSFAKVKLAVDTSQNDKTVAVKIMRKSHLRAASVNLNKVNQEVEVMRSVRHSNLVRAYSVIDDPNSDKLYLVMEYMDGGSWEQAKDLPWEASVLRHRFQDVVRGLHHLHSNNITHRDIKPANVLMDRAGTCKLGDFGASSILRCGKHMTNTTPGTPIFFSPEMLRDGTYDGQAADVWALGVTMYIIAYGTHPFSGKTFSEVARSVLESEVDFPNVYKSQSIWQRGRKGSVAFHDSNENLPSPLPSRNVAYPPSLVDLLRGMLVKDPRKRFTVDDILAHAYFAEATGVTSA